MTNRGGGDDGTARRRKTVQLVKASRPSIIRRSPLRSGVGARINNGQEAMPWSTRVPRTTEQRGLSPRGSDLHHPE